MLKVFLISSGVFPLQKQSSPLRIKNSRKIIIFRHVLLTLDHVGHCLAGDVKEAFDVKVVCCQDQLKESSLVNLHKKTVPVLKKVWEPGVLTTLHMF